MTEGATEPLARSDKRVARTRAAVLDAAEAMVAERDIDAVRIEDVAARAGVSAASVYVHFKTKDGLLAAVVDRLMEVSTRALEEAIDANAEPFDRWAGIGIAYIRLLVEHPALLRYLASVGDRGPATAAERAIDDRMAALRQRFEDQITAAIASGRMRSVDARGLSYFLMGAWNGAASLALRKDGLALDRAAIEQSVLTAGAALVRGLAAG